MTLFYVGLHHPNDAWRFDRCMVSVAALQRKNKRTGEYRDRKSDFTVNEWILDSGAFTEVSRHGRFRQTPEQYAAKVVRWSRCGKLLAAVSQDWMCEPEVLEKTGLTVKDHQRLTIERYVALRPLVGSTYLLPVLQGYWPDEYVSHIGQYGERLAPGQWVGVGSVCKRNARIEEIEAVLRAVKLARPELRLHGFGVKVTALQSSVVRNCLDSADSMAWSKAARKEGRDQNSWREADAFRQRIEGQTPKHRSYQDRLFYDK